MQQAGLVGRVGVLAPVLGVGAGLAATPWVASVAPPGSSDTSGSSTAPGQNMSVATNGVIRVTKGSATALSFGGQVTVAIAKGVNRSAIAGTAMCTECVVGNHNKAIVKGDGSTATVSGSDDTAAVIGNSDGASINGGPNNTATATNSNSALASIPAGSGDSTATLTNSLISTAISDGGSDNTAIVITGDYSSANAGGGDNNTPTAAGPDSHAAAGPGDGCTATAGPHSTAIAP